MPAQHWTIQEVARRAGVSSRTLRHYDHIGLLPPSGVTAKGYRQYDAQALVRLQRILLMRQLGLPLETIRQMIDEQQDEVVALTEHLASLREEVRRLERQIASVEHTVAALGKKENPMASTMFDGFDHTQYKEEVEAKYGEKAYADSANWWESLSDDDKRRMTLQAEQLIRDWQAAAASGIAPTDQAGQLLAARQVDWLSANPGFPGSPEHPDYDCIVGVAEMYVADERFQETYGGLETVSFLRDAVSAYAKQSRQAE